MSRGSIDFSLSDVLLRRLNRATHRVHALPLVVLMPHSRCNCRCVMCDIWKANRQQRELSLEELQPHLEQFRQLRVRWVVFSGGEALLYGSLWQLCEQLEELGIRKTLLSTGLLLERDARQVARWIDDVVVSLDGPRAVHDSIRRIPGAFEKLATGVRAVRTKRPGVDLITGRCVVQRENWRVLEQTVDAAKLLGLDSISFLPADVSTEAFNRPSPWDDARVAEVALTTAEADELMSLIDRLAKDRAPDFESGFIVESPDKLRTMVDYWRAIAGQGELPRVRCNAPWVSAVVEADGGVKPCFFHPEYGNLHRSSLREILESPSARKFRRQLDVATDPTCQRCVCSLNL